MFVISVIDPVLVLFYYSISMQFSMVWDSEPSISTVHPVLNSAANHDHDRLIAFFKQDKFYLNINRAVIEGSTN